MTMPALFVGHGNPMNAIQDNQWSKAFQSLSEGVPKPRAVLAISAHYYTQGTHLTGNEDPKTIHDFGGFPPALYEVQYPVKGDPGLAKRTADMLRGVGADVRQDWGIDHGTWSVLRHMYPKADVPIVQLSIDATAAMETHWQIGEALRPLRDDGVLIVGSGNITHNLRRAFGKMRTRDTSTESMTIEFDERAARAVEQGDKDWLVSALDTDAGRDAHPTPDHYLPLVYSAGAGQGDDVSFPVEGFDMGDLSMRSVRFDA
ncbi:MAG: 4,5-DOPA dioxygenase extradiol [Thermoplasmatota archaeon]